MSTQYVIAGVLIVGGLVTAWAGPDLGVRADGTPFSPSERPWVRAFGIGCAACGMALLVATLLGFRAPPAEGPGAP